MTIQEAKLQNLATADLLNTGKALKIAGYIATAISVAVLAALFFSHNPASIQNLLANPINVNLSAFGSAAGVFGLGSIFLANHLKRKALKKYILHKNYPFDLNSDNSTGYIFAVKEYENSYKIKCYPHKFANFINFHVTHLLAPIENKKIFKLIKRINKIIGYFASYSFCIPK